MLVGVQVGELFFCLFIFLFQAEDGIRDAQESRGLGDVYKRQLLHSASKNKLVAVKQIYLALLKRQQLINQCWNCSCLLYTSDAADELLCVDLGGRRFIKKKKNTTSI